MRVYEEPDESQVNSLWAKCELAWPWNDPRKDIARKLKVQRELFLVGVKDGKVIATALAGYDGHRGRIIYFAVAVVHRAQGHAAALIRHVESYLLTAGCPKTNLQLCASNTKAVEFYRYIGCAQDEVVGYSKRLISDAPAA